MCGVQESEEQQVTEVGLVDGFVSEELVGSVWDLYGGYVWGYEMALFGLSELNV